MHSPNDESSLIQRIEAALGAKAPSFGVGIGDDAALWKARPGRDVILTCDWFLEGSHFWRDVHPPDVVGWKCLARATSDVAAMGGEPRCFLLSLALPESQTGTWMTGFLGGLRRASRALKCPLAGGDTTRNEKILISVTVVGEVKKGHAALRSGARKGDAICVSGRLGGAQLGLELLIREKTGALEQDEVLEKHFYPVPRIDLGRKLTARKLVTAMMDLSDGLSSDLQKLCAASRVGARIFETRIPLAGVIERQRIEESERLRAALHGGDDYELLFTVPKRKVKRMRDAIGGVPITVIGEVQGGRQIILTKKDGTEEPLQNAGWDPFRHDKKSS